MARNVVGLDIGGTSLRAVEVANAATAKPRIVKAAEIAIPAGAVRRGEVLEPNTVASALKRLWSQGGFSSKHVVLGIGNQRVLARDLSVPAMPLAQIKESLPFHVQDLLPMPVSEAVLDFYPLREADADGGRVVEGLLIAAAKDAVMMNVAAARVAGLRPIGVDLIPFALTRLLSPKNAGAGSVIIIDVGESTTSFVYSVGGVPQFVRLIGMGGGDITRAIAGRLKLDEASAENAKRSFGLTAQTVTEAERPIVEIIYEVASELVSNIRNTITYVTNTHGAFTFERIILSGSGSNLAGLPRALAENTRTPVAIAAPFEGFSTSRSVKKLDQRRTHGMAVALGLALGVTP